MLSPSGPLLAALSGLLLLIPAGVGGCASGAPAVFVAEDAPAPEEIRTVLLVAMNFDETPHPALARGVERLEDHVSAYLRDSGRRVVRVRLRDVLPLWQELADEHGGFLEEDGETLREESVEAARAELARKLGEAHSVDAIAMPTLRLREGWYVGRYLRWDGATRRVPVEVAQNDVYELHGLSGKGTGTSLRMTLYDRNGRKFFERHAALEPTMRATIRGIGSLGGAETKMNTRNDLFRDPAILEEGVALSLTPVLEPPVASGE